MQDHLHPVALLLLGVVVSCCPLDNCPRLLTEMRRVQAVDEVKKMQLAS